jgi:uncharacterized protein HemY
MGLGQLGKWLFVAGLALAAVGLFLLLAARLGIRLGRLPGDVLIQRGNLRIYIPIATSILLSLLLSLVLWLLSRR